MEPVLVSPAEQASLECLNTVLETIKIGKSFRLEAGAGAGKTYTLIKSLKYLIESKSEVFLKKNQQVACITYTNVAKDEIQSRTDNHPVVFAETIHAFCWNLIKDFQKNLRAFLPELTPRWAERVNEVQSLNQLPVIYNLGFPKISDTEILLHHDDVIKLMSHLLNDSKFRSIVKARFPVILIDEYQDTNKLLAETIVNNFIEQANGPLIGFFGDHWQKIYGSSSCGLITSPSGNLVEIGKNANFRSDRLIVEALNRIRPELTQNVSDPNSGGGIFIFDSNNWSGQRRSENHWGGDLPETEAHKYLRIVKVELESQGWVFEAEKTKILMLTNNVLASEQGYHNLISIFSDTDDLLKKNNDYISFLVDTVEPAAEAFAEGKYGDMFRAIGIKTAKVRRHSDKELWHAEMSTLLQLRTQGSIGDVISLLKKTKKPMLPSKIDEKENRYHIISEKPIDERTEEERKEFEKIEKLKAVPYKELINLSNYIDNKTLFSTKHGVKGAEFDNVLIVFGRGWNHYNWTQMLEWIQNGIPKGKDDTFERNRNLFYVACSRPKRNLALLFTQELSETAKKTLSEWFAVPIVSL